MDAVHAFDLAVRQGIHDCASPLLTSLMIGVTTLGADAVLIAIGACFCLWMIMAKRYSDFVLFIATSLAAWLLYAGLNTAIHRARPEPYFGFPLPGGYSLPSGHAVKSMVVYPVMAMLATPRPFAHIAAVAVAAVIGISRIYLGVHWPTDVLAGWAVAWFCLAVFYMRTRPQRRIPV